MIPSLLGVAWSTALKIAIKSKPQETHERAVIGFRFAQTIEMKRMNENSFEMCCNDLGLVLDWGLRKKKFSLEKKN